jgi:hypothetical protein
MRCCRVLIAFVAGAVIALPVALSAQPAPSSKAPRGKQQRTQPEPEYEVEELTPDQIRRAQEPEAPAQRNNTPLRGTAPASTATTAPPKPPATAAAVGAEPAGPARNIACSGTWSKDASHIKLANIFKLENVVFTDVPGPGTTKVMATVVFPKDPKRRLEVWWRNETSRSGLYLIVINGQSTWSVPKGLKLGLGLAAIEKLNGKPFKLQGFGKDGGNTTDWDGGALGALPGGCKVGLKFAADPKAPQAARDEVMVEREFESTDPAMRAARPSIAEIILGY